MNKFIETTGKNEDEAVSAALALLGRAREDVTVEILERAKQGFLGLGASPAKVRVSYECEDDAVTRVRSFVSGLLERLGSDAEPEVTQSGENSLLVELKGENLGSLIGRRGETLDAIQHITNYAVNRAGGTRLRVSVDAENYRAKRTEALEQLARKMAAKVVRFRRDMSLEAMNSYERHVIHAALQDYAGVATESTGIEPNRRVIVKYVFDRSAAPRQANYGRRR